MKNIGLLTLLIMTSGLAYGDEGGGAAKERVGPGKAVEAANEKEGFRLSEKALKSMALSFAKVISHQQAVPTQALVSFQDFSAIYRYRDGWFRLVEIEPSVNSGRASFSSKEFRPGDQMVVQGGNMLRVVELDIFGPEADACAD